MYCHTSDPFALQNYPGGFYCWSLQPPMHPVFVSDGYFHQLGYAPQPMSVLLETAIYPFLTASDRLALLRRVVDLAPGETTSLHYACRRPDAAVAQLWDTVRCVRADDGGRYLYGYSSIITQQWAQYCLLQDQAQRESMTGLLNHGTITHRITAWLQAHPAAPCALGLLDLDGLKFLNDTFGHLWGDRALCAVARLMEQIFGQIAWLGRVGGDEFALFFPQAQTDVELMRKFTALLQQIAAIPIGPQGACYVRCSAGCVQSTPTDTFETLYQKADVALYHVKNNGKNHVCLYRPHACSHTKSKFPPR